MMNTKIVSYKENKKTPQICQRRISRLLERGKRTETIFQNEFSAYRNNYLH